MADKTLEESLRDAGLDEASVRLIADNKVLAEPVAKNAKQLCDRFRLMMAGVHTPATTSKYKGKIDVARIPAIAAAIRARGKKPTADLIAKEFGCTPGNLSKAKDKFPEIKKALRAVYDGEI